MYAFAAELDEWLRSGRAQVDGTLPEVLPPRASTDPPLQSTLASELASNLATSGAALHPTAAGRIRLLIAPVLLLAVASLIFVYVKNFRRIDSRGTPDSHRRCRRSLTTRAPLNRPIPKKLRPVSFISVADTNGTSEPRKAWTAPSLYFPKRLSTTRPWRRLTPGWLTPTI